MEDSNLFSAVVGGVLWALLIVVFFLLLRDKEGTHPFWMAFKKALICMVFFVLISFIVMAWHNGFDMEGFEDIKKLIMLVSLLVSGEAAKKLSENTSNNFTKILIRLYGGFSILLSLCIVIAVYSRIDSVNSIVNMLNDLWGIGVTLYAAFVMFLISEKPRQTDK